MINKRYGILDMDLTLTTDSVSFAESFEMDYGLFALSGPPWERRLSCEFFEKGKGGARLSINGAPCLEAASLDTPLHPYQILTARLMKDVRGFTIVHGGVVAKENRPLVICGPSGSGKTTLGAALLEEGFQYFSDDFCPFNDETGLVHPFPRTMWRVSPDDEHTAGQAGNPAAGVFVRAGKTPLRLDPEKIPIASEPCRAASVIYIDPGDQADRLLITRVQLSAPGKDILKKAANDARGVTVEPRPGRAMNWEIRYPRGSGHAPKVIALLKAIEPYTLNKYRVDSYKPDFNQVPRLTPLAAHEMAHLLLGELKSDPDTLRELPGRYFMKMIEHLAQARCWRLTTGRLDRMKSAAIGTLAEEG
ncbi:MAG: hypothetical protein K4571_08085 [Deltaproteobacteria bacterium]